MMLFAYKGRYHVRDSNTIETLSSIAKANGYKTSLVYDQDVFGVSDNVLPMPLLNKIFSSARRTAKRALDAQPSILVYLDSFSSREWIYEVLALVKEQNSNIKTVCVSMRDNSVKGFDYTLKGEPELVFESFLKSGASSSLESGGLSDINLLPLPDKELFGRYVSFKDSYIIYASKGCPQRCSFCEETLMAKGFGPGYFRKRSPSSVISELAWAKAEYGIKEVIFKDSVFTQDKKWLSELLNQYSEKIAVPFKCFAKASSFDEETAAALKSAGCYCVEFGVQSFNEELKSGVLNRNEKLSDIRKALATCERAGLAYDLDHMFGIPKETAQDHLRALEFYAGLKGLNRIKCHNMVVYPGSDMEQYLSANADSRGFHSSTKGVNACFEKIFKTYPLLPGFIKRALLKGDTYKVFKYVPSFMVILLQAVRGLTNGDIRFKVYFKYYPVKVLSAFRGA